MFHSLTKTAKPWCCADDSHPDDFDDATVWMDADSPTPSGPAGRTHAVTDIATRSKPPPPSARTSKYCSPEKCATRDALPTAADPPGLAGEKCGDATLRSQRPSASAASAAARSSACVGVGGCCDAAARGGGGGEGAAVAAAIATAEVAAAAAGGASTGAAAGSAAAGGASCVACAARVNHMP